MPAFAPPQKVAVNVTLNPVGPRTNITSQWFGIHLSMGWDAPNATAPTTPDTSLLPWNLTLTGFMAVIFDRTTGLADPGQFSVQIQALPAGIREPRLQNQMSAVCQKWVTDQKFQLSHLPDSPSVIQDNQTPVHDLTSVMGFLSTFSGEVPQALNLTHYIQFALPAGKTLTPGHDYSMIVAPESADWAVNPTALLAAWAGDPEAWRSGIDCGANLRSYSNALDFRVEANGLIRFSGEPVTTPGTSQKLGLNFSDFWCRSQESFAWGSHLNTLAEATVDLPTLVDNYLGKKETDAPDLALSYRLMSRFAQWDDPSTSTTAGMTTFDLLTAIAAVKPLPGTAHPSAIDTTECKARLQAFYNLLQNNATAQTTWQSMLTKQFPANLGKDATSYYRDPTTRQAFSLRLLLAQWDYAITCIPGNIAVGAAGDPTAAWRESVPSVWPHDQAPVPGSLTYIFEEASRHIRNNAIANLNGLLLLGPEQCEQYLLTSIDSVRNTDAEKEFQALSKILCDWLKAEHQALFVNGQALLPNVSTNLPSAMSATENFTVLQGTPPAPVVNSISTWDRWVDEAFTSRYLSPLSPGLDQKPRGLSIQVDGFTCDPETGVENPEEIVWRKLAGIGVLVKPDGGRWRLCSAASVLSHTSTPSDEPLFAQPAVVPVRIPLSGAHRVPIIEYNQRSLIVPNPLGHALSDDYELSPTDTVLSDKLYSFAPARGVDSMLLTRLKYGKNYRMAAFMIDASGGMPTELTRGYPWQFDYSLQDGALKGLEASDSSIAVPFSYKRRTGIGAPRLYLEDEQERNQIPDQVYPIAREISPSDGLYPLAKNLASNNPDQHDPAPLSLLWDDNPDCNIRLRPPSVDIDVLERWLPEETPSDKDHLKQLLIDNYSWLVACNRDKNKQTLMKSGENFSLDDPAVSGHLILIDQYNFESGLWQTVDGWRQPIGSPPPGNGAAKHQSAAVEITVKRSSDPEETTINRASSSVNQVTITLPTAQTIVVRVRTHALVPRVLIDVPPAVSSKTKLEPIVISSQMGSNWSTQSINDFWLSNTNLSTANGLGEQIKNEIALDAQSVLIESANTALPDATSVWQALQLSLDSTGAVKIDVVAPVDGLSNAGQSRFWRSGSWRNIGSCEIIKQDWRWQGAHVVPPLTVSNTWPTSQLAPSKWWDSETFLPELNGKDPAANFSEMLAWEKTVCMHLHDKFDSLVIPAAYRVVCDGAQALLPASSYLDSFNSDKKSHYVRYALRMVSRYAGLLYGDTRNVESSEYIVVIENGVTSHYPVLGLGWKRVFIPYRGTIPSKPVVKAILPLTSSPRINSTTAAPLMVVLDETAFKECGISESVSCSIEFDSFSNLYQIGTDPIITGKGLTADKVVESRLEGPFGHTFDTDGHQSLYSASSYLLTTLTAPDGTVLNDAWTFAKVQLRRLSGNSSLDAASVNVPNTQLYTKPVWVQFLPDRDSTFGAVRAVQNADKLTLSIAVSGAQDNTALFDYWLLVTKQIVDFQGQGDRELYDRIVPLKLSGNSLQTDQISLNLSQCLFRIVERQKSSIPPSNPDDQKRVSTDFWWSVLGNTELDAPARITRISSPKTLDS